MASVGKLIALEGIDGSGTTTQAKLLAAKLAEAGHQVHLTAEPSEGRVGKLIRRVLLGEEKMEPDALALLFAADRLDHIDTEIMPRLQTGCVVLTDRYLLSSLAYQSLDNPIQWVRDINGRAKLPDLSVLLRVDAETAAARRRARGGVEELFDTDQKQRRVADAYDEVIARRDIGRVAAIDAKKGFDAVAEELWELVYPAVAKGGSDARE